MRRMLWGMLMAAGALLPGLANAQEEGRGGDGGRPVLRADTNIGSPDQRSDGPRAGRGDWQGRREGGDWQGRRDGGGGQGWQQRQQAQPQPASPPPAPATAPQAYGRSPGDGRGWNRDAAGQRPDWNRGGEAARPLPNGDGPRATQGAGSQPGRPAWNGGRSDGQRPAWARGDEFGRPAWNGGTGQRPDGRGPDPRPEARGSDRDRGDHGWRDGNARPDGRRDWRDEAARRPPSTGWQRDRADWVDNGRDNRRFDSRASWNRGWRDDRRYDWNRYRATNRGAYHLPRYYAPSGWGYGYRRFSIGVTLSSILFAQSYWIDDPWDYRLPPAEGPYRWVRYYNDALLVDVRYGQVVDTVYDIFW